MNNGAFGENFPYCNNHDLNLDWIIKEIREDRSKTDENTQAINELEVEVADLQARLPVPIEYESFFQNKTVMVCGDSISDENTYPPNWVTHFRNYLSEVNGTLINKSVSGILLSGSGGMAQSIQAFTETDVDIIVIEVGTNDCNVQASIGNNQSTDINTLIGALKTMRTSIVSKYPRAQVFYIMPPKCALSDSTVPPIAKQWLPRCVYRYVLAMWCNQFNWNIIDATCGLPQFDLLDPVIRNMYSDGIHPKSNYALIMMEYIVQQMISGGTTWIGFEQTKIDYSQFINTEAFSNGYAEINFDSHGNIHLLITGNCLQTDTVKILDNLPVVFRDILIPGYSPYGFVLGSELRIIMFDQGGASISVQTTQGINARLDYTLNLSERLGQHTVISQ